MPLATVGVGGFDSRPVADAATSGDRRTRLHDDHAHRYGTAPVVFARATGVAPDLHRDRAHAFNRDAARPARKGQGEPVNNLNSILLEGNLARDPELRYTPKGTPICTLNVASTRTYKLDGERVEEVSFVEATTCGKLATVCAEHLSKGRGIRVVGRIKQERWEADGPDGYQPRDKVVIVAEHVEFQPVRNRAQAEAAEAKAS